MRVIRLPREPFRRPLIHHEVEAKGSFESEAVCVRRSRRGGTNYERGHDGHCVRGRGSPAGAMYPDSVIHLSLVETGGGRASVHTRRARTRSRRGQRSNVQIQNAYSQHERERVIAEVFNVHFGLTDNGFLSSHGFGLHGSNIATSANNAMPRTVPSEKDNPSVGIVKCVCSEYIFTK